MPALPEASSPQRARGAVRVGAGLRDGETHLTDLHQAGSLKALFPQRRGAELACVLLNTAGGITGGDEFDIALTARADTQITFTTQAAERIYRAPSGPAGSVHTRISAQAGTHLTWLPQETILFDGAALDRHLEIDAEEGAELLLCETLMFGRLAMGETVHDLRLKDRIDVRVGGELIFADRLRLNGDAQVQLDRMGVADGARALASVVLYAPNAAARLTEVADMLPARAGASAITNDLVFLRFLGEDAFEIRETLVPVLVALGDSGIPRTWTI